MTGLSESWRERLVSDCVLPVDVDRHKKVLARAYKATGKFPIVDQGQELIAGRTDDETAVVADGLPIVVFGDHTRVFKFVDFPFVIGADGTKLLKPIADLDPKFFYFACLTLDIPSRGYNRHFKILREQSIRYPELAEQQKIAAVLWQIQKAVEIEDAIVRNARDLKKSLLRCLFSHGLHGEPLKETEIGPLPQSWELKECESVCDMITVGIVVQPGSHYVPAGVPAFRSLNIREDRLDTSSLVHVSTEANDTILSKSKLRTGDVLVVRTGYPGTSCVVPNQFDGANCIDLVILRPARTMVAEFLSRFFNSESGRQQALNAKTGLAQQHLNTGAVKRMKVPFPSLDEQREIANILQTVDRKIDIHESKKRSLQDLFKTTLHKLMTAQIRVNDLDVDTSELSR